jgi:hypothetical protein
MSQETNHMKTYQLSRKGPGTSARAALNVPAHIARHLPDGMQFAVELIDDGILYRPVGITAEPADLPDWVTAAFDRGAA